MAVLANALFLALISVASAADSADCGAEDATSLIQMKSTLEQGEQKKVSAKDKDKSTCTEPEVDENMEDDQGKWIRPGAEGYAQCLQNNCEDSTSDLVRYWSHAQVRDCKELTKLYGCDLDADPGIRGDLFNVLDMKIWKMCGATCKEQCNAARLEKKVDIGKEDDIVVGEDDSSSSMEHYFHIHGPRGSDPQKRKRRPRRRKVVSDPKITEASHALEIAARRINNDNKEIADQKDELAHDDSVSDSTQNVDERATQAIEKATNVIAKEEDEIRAKDATIGALSKIEEERQLAKVCNPEGKGHIENFKVNQNTMLACCMMQCGEKVLKDPKVSAAICQNDCTISRLYAMKKRILNPMWGRRGP